MQLYTVKGAMKFYQTDTFAPILVYERRPPATQAPPEIRWKEKPEAESSERAEPDMSHKVYGLMRALADTTKISLRLIRGKTRDKPTVRARRLAIYIMRTHFGMSYSDIGLELCKDHSTAIGAFKIIESEIHLGQNRVYYNQIMDRIGLPDRI